MSIRLASVFLGLCLLPLSTIADGSAFPPDSVRLAQNGRRDLERDRDRDRGRDQRDRDRDQRDPRDQIQQEDRWTCRSITIAEFKSWFAGFTEAKEGGLPSRKQWWRLRAIIADIEEGQGLGRKCKTE
jgi:hypothetical protein